MRINKSQLDIKEQAELEVVKESMSDSASYEQKSGD